MKRIAKREFVCDGCGEREWKRLTNPELALWTKYPRVHSCKGWTRIHGIWREVPA